MHIPKDSLTEAEATALTALLVDAFGSEVAADAWLRAPAIELGGAVPARCIALGGTRLAEVRAVLETRVREAGLSPAEYLGLVADEGEGDSDALTELAEVLRGTVRTGEIARKWMRDSVPGLGGRRPIDLVTDGEIEQVVRLLRRIEQRADS